MIPRHQNNKFQSATMIVASKIISLRVQAPWAGTYNDAVLLMNLLYIKVFAIEREKFLRK